MRKLGLIAAVLVCAWLCFIGVVYAKMRNPAPERIAGFMAGIPGPLYLAIPFETLWFRARAGVLENGTAAPDFTLETVDKRSHVSLSAFRGSKPVVLIFGSYT